MSICYKKWSVINIQTAKYKYNKNNSIKFEIESIKSSICHHSNAFILVTGKITVNAGNNTDGAIKNCAPFSTCKADTNDVFLMKQILLILQCICIIWLNIVIIIRYIRKLMAVLKRLSSRWW